MKKTAALIMAAVLILLVLPSCKKDNIPALTDAQAQERIAALLPKAMEFMQIAYGTGLGTVYTPEEGEAAVSPLYRPVAESAAYHSKNEMKADAEKVFSSDYLKNTLYIVLFDGYRPPEETKEKDTVVSNYINPRFTEEDGKLLEDVLFNSNQIRTEPDVSTARVISGSSVSAVCELSYRMEGGEGGTMRLTLVLENGVWLFDGPTY